MLEQKFDHLHLFTLDGVIYRPNVGVGWDVYVNIHVDEFFHQFPIPIFCCHDNASSLSFVVLSENSFI